MGGDFGSHNDSAVGIYCAEAKEANESVINATHKILPSKNAKSTPIEKTQQDVAYEKQWKMKLEKWAPVSPWTANATQISVLIDRQRRVWKFWNWEVIWSIF